MMASVAGEAGEGSQGASSEEPTSASVAENDERQCFICLDGDMPSNRLVHGGCGCRGSAGFAHIDCIVQAARAQANTVEICPTCKLRWKGAMEIGVARGYYDFFAARPEDDLERLGAACGLSQTLSDNGQTTEALELCVSTLATTRQAFESPLALAAVSVLAGIHHKRGDNMAALPLIREALAISLRLHGDDDRRTLGVTTNLVKTHVALGDYGEALPLATDTLERMRRVLGSDHHTTLLTMETLADIHKKMGQHDVALAVRRETVERGKRVLGSQHQDTLRFLRKLVDDSNELPLTA